MFGSHLSIAGSLINALDQAQTLGLDTVQIFTKNQQQWKAKPLDSGVVTAWRERVSTMGWQTRTVSHASYLINLASPDDELWRKSIDLMTDEIERCEALGVPFLVHHPGAFTTSTREEGLSRIAKAYTELFKRTPGYATVSCLENTVGGGSTIGRTFEELSDLRARIVGGTAHPGRIGFCIDSCHLHAGGYDLSTRKSAEAVLDQLEQVIGAGSVRVLHLNDSKGAMGSRLDRHEHIGRGTIGEAGFSAILARSIFRAIPKIMETPKDDPQGGVAWDTVNLDRLKALAPKASSDTAGVGGRGARGTKSRAHGA